MNMLMHRVLLRRCSLVARQRRCFSTTDIVAERREAERAAKRERRNAAEEKRAAVAAYLASISGNASNEEPSEPEDETRGQAWRDAERAFLMEEAGSMSKSLYRTCLRSVRTLRPGNDRDELDFKKREDQQFSDLNDEGGDIIFSMEPPVNRQNELQSRADYYYTHLRENYNSDSECLDREPWQEQDIEVFVHFFKQGEKRRRYVLKDYRFNDPYKSAFDAGRVKLFQTRANELLRDTYKANGWMLMSDVKPEDYDTEYDPHFDFSDSPEDKVPKL